MLPPPAPPAPHLRPALRPVAFTLAVIVNVSAPLTVVATFEPLTEYLIHGATVAAIYGDPRRKMPATADSSPPAEQ